MVLQKNLFRIIIFLIFSSLSFGQTQRILLDEIFSDWDNIPLIHDDPTGDNSGNPIDFGALKGFNDDNYLFFYIEVGSELTFQENNGITIYLDTDNNQATGFSIANIGAELVYTFGDREGTAYLGGGSSTVGQENIGHISSPTVASDRFEICFNRESIIGGNYLFTSDVIKIVWVDELGIDVLPDNGSVEYTFMNQSLEPLPSFSIDKAQSDYLRILSYNVLGNGLFQPNRFDNFQRILSAVNPDIIAFQEIGGYSAEETRAKVEEMMPGSGPWFAEKRGDDLVVVSIYEITQTFEINTTSLYSQTNGAFLLNLQTVYGTDLLLIDAHLKCCGGNTNEDIRQHEVDAIMKFIREAKTPGGDLTLPENTPIIITGDMNLVGTPRPRETLLTGNIFYEGDYGTDFIPDWDGTDLEDSKPYSTSIPMTITWYDEGSSFAPGRLDYNIYSGSVLSKQNSFALFTPALDNSLLAQHNLQANDAVDASDHLPVVVDFEVGETVDVELTSFNGIVVDEKVQLNWTTATETNNSGFLIERRGTIEVKGQKLLPTEQWSGIGFVDGSGNSSVTRKYQFIDSDPIIGSSEYRLKQINFDGSFEYYKPIELDYNRTFQFNLEQNYPNPFNPTTTITYEIGKKGFVSLTVYNILGTEIAKLENGEKPSGFYTVEFDATNLPSSIYFYVLKSGNYVEQRKMILLK